MFFPRGEADQWYASGSHLKMHQLQEIWAQLPLWSTQCHSCWALQDGRDNLGLSYNRWAANRHWWFWHSSISSHEQIGSWVWGGSSSSDKVLTGLKAKVRKCLHLYDSSPDFTTWEAELEKERDKTHTESINYVDFSFANEKVACFYKYSERGAAL